MALSALAGGVGGGVAKLGLFANFGKVGSAVANGLLSSTVTQGIAVATGLQDKFSWAGVAAAGVAGGVGSFLGDKVFHTQSLLTNQSFGNVGATLLTGAARTIASAATRSLIEGTDFGDNVVAGLPDVIGQTVVDLITGSALAKVRASRAAKPDVSAPKPAGADSSSSGGNDSTDAKFGDIIVTATRFKPIEFRPISLSDFAVPLRA